VGNINVLEMGVNIPVELFIYVSHGSNNKAAVYKAFQAIPVRPETAIFTQLRPMIPGV